jgi:heptosyltransferase-1
MKAKNICILRSGAIGDVIHTLPLVNILSKSFKQKRITYAMSGELAPLFQYAKGIDQIFPLNLKTGLGGLIKQAKSLKEAGNGQFTDFINLQPNLKSKFTTWLVKPEEVFELKKNKNGTEHAWENFATSYFHPADLDLTEFDVQENLPFIEIPNEVVFNLLFKLQLNLSKKNIAIIPGVGKHRPHRAWPIKHWVSLLKFITENSPENPSILLIGGAEEEKLAEDICALLREHKKLKFVNLCGKLDLLTTAAILKKCSLAIGADTGPTHLAAAMGTKTIALFGPTSPVRHAPFCGVALQAPDYKCSHLCSSKKCERTILNCMDTLTPEQVWLSMSEI